MESSHTYEPERSDALGTESTSTKSDEPVLRIEFYGNAGPADREQGVHTPPAAPSHDDTTLRAVEATPPEGSAAHAVEREEELARREDIVAEQEANTQDRADELARREQALVGSEGLVEAESADVERRERRLAQMESTVKDRMRELDAREFEVERRELELEAAFSLREDRIEQREADLAELEGRLTRKEEDLVRYVTQVQAEFARRP